jgi:hypothetical protein
VPRDRDGVEVVCSHVFVNCSSGGDNSREQSGSRQTKKVRQPVLTEIAAPYSKCRSADFETA